MLKKILPYKLFIVSMSIAPFLAFFLKSGILSYGIPISLLFFIFSLELTSSFPTKVRDWIAFFIWIPFAMWAGFYYIKTPYQGLYITTYSLTIITLPFIVLSFIRLQSYLSSSEYYNFTYKLLLFFCIGQLVICLGQISTYTLGIGFPVNELYSYMIAGTFFNSNNLACIILLISYIFTGVEHISKKSYLFWLLIALLLVVAGSRSAILIAGMLFLLTRGLSLKNLIFSFIAFIGIYLLLFHFLASTDNSVFSRFTTRLSSLFDVLQGGIESDDSSSLRLDSYIHFFKNIDRLGFGSGELVNYIKYSNDATFSTGLMFRNPHSLLVEIGYWLGIPGLFAFVVATTYLLRYSRQKFILVIILVISSLIPSSVLNNPTYFLFMIQSFFTISTNYEPKKYRKNLRMLLANR